jgi:hypothetical protein
MITAGLNEPEDIHMGQAKGTFASVKAFRGPMSDRIADEAAYFERFLRYDFWGATSYLKSVISEFPRQFSVVAVVDFKKKAGASRLFAIWRARSTHHVFDFL